MSDEWTTRCYFVNYCCGAGLKASEQIGLSQDRVSTIVRAFYASLFSTFAPQFERLQDPSLREAIRIKIAQRMYAAHKTVSDLIIYSMPLVIIAAVFVDS